MAYVITRFGAVALPQADARQDVGTGKTRRALSPISGGGSWEPHGSTRSRRNGRPLVVHGQIIAASEAAVQTQLDALLALWDTRAKLYRNGRGNGQTAWVWATLNDVTPEVSPRMPLSVPVDLEFLVETAYWHGMRHGVAPWTIGGGMVLGAGYELGDVTDQFALAGSPQAITLNNGGNAPVIDPIITITAGSAALTTSVTVSNTTTGTAFTWTGTIASGQALVVDVAAQTVKNNGVAAYTGFTWTAEDWFRIDPGSNSVSVTYTGGGTGPTILFDFHDHWI